MNRITPERALAAYVAQGLRPMQVGWADVIGDQRCACGLSAVYAHEYGEFDDLLDAEIDDEQHVVISKAAGLSKSYVAGFVCGFDGGICVEELGEDWKAGCADGKACWAAVKHLVPGDE